MSLCKIDRQLTKDWESRHQLSSLEIMCCKRHELFVRIGTELKHMSECDQKPTVRTAIVEELIGTTDENCTQFKQIFQRKCKKLKHRLSRRSIVMIADNNNNLNTTSEAVANCSFSVLLWLSIAANTLMIIVIIVLVVFLIKTCYSLRQMQTSTDQHSAKEDRAKDSDVDTGTLQLDKDVVKSESKSVNGGNNKKRRTSYGKFVRIN